MSPVNSCATGHQKTAFIFKPLASIMRNKHSSVLQLASVIVNYDNEVKRLHGVVADKERNLAVWRSALTELMEENRLLKQPRSGPSAALLERNTALSEENASLSAQTHCTCKESDAVLKLEKKRKKISGLTAQLEGLKSDHYLEIIHQEEQQSSHQSKLLRQIADLHRRIQSCETLLQTSRKDNEYLARKLAGSCKQDTQSDSPRSLQLSHIHSIKNKTEKLYRDLILQMNRTQDSDGSVYSLKSPELSKAEKGLNEVIVALHDLLSCKENAAQQKKSSCSVSTRWLGCISPTSPKRKLF